MRIGEIRKALLSGETSCLDLTEGLCSSLNRTDTENI